MDSTKLQIVKTTAPLLKQHSKEIGTHFYKLLFKRAPELANMFNQTNQKRGIQQEALAYSVYAAGENLDSLENIKELVMRVAEKHVGLGVKAEQYPVVGETLLQAVKDVLGSGATDEVIGAWKEAYDLIADTFIKIENDLYDKKAQTAGGWRGFRNFRVAKKERESKFVTSFYLEPEDGQPLPEYEPGQYLTLKADIQGEPYTHMRHYSLSHASDNDFYRISVKRELGTGDVPDGIVSNYLHEHIEKGDILPFAVPAGDFTVKSEELPIVLIGGGIGLTPLMSMLQTLVKKDPNRQITYIHATQNSTTHTMREAIEKLASEYENLRTHIIYDSPTEADRKAFNFHKEGHIDLEWMQSVLPDNEGDFYFCGPIPFMKAVLKGLQTWGVSDERIHYESFSPISILEKEPQEEEQKSELVGVK